MITRPPLGVWVGMLASLVFVGALSLTTLFSSHDRPPGAAVSFWWARLAPFSYALHALRTTPVVTIVDDSLYCPDPESLLQSWRTIAANPRSACCCSQPEIGRASCRKEWRSGGWPKQ